MIMVFLNWVAEKIVSGSVLSLLLLYLAIGHRITIAARDSKVIGIPSADGIGFSQTK